MDWSYLAGYFDGEGCLLLGIVRDKRKEKTVGTKVEGWSISPSLSITSGDYEVLLKMEKFLSLEGIKTSKMNFRKPRKHQLRKYMRLSIHGWGKIARCIKKMLPYSIAKKKQLELFFKLRDIVYSKPCGKTKRNTHGVWTKELFLSAMEKVDEINSLKSRLRGKMNTNYFKKLWSEEVS